MDITTRDQIFSLIDKSQSILLLTHAKADCDGLGSMISMYLTLQSLGKEVVAATNDPAPDNLGFLPAINLVQNSIASRNFVITLDISRTPLNKIKYKLTDDQKSVNIVVTPSAGHFKPEDVKFNHEQGNFDLIITFDTGNLEHLGPIYDQNSELFFKIPVINIDHHASNTDYGKVNLVDVVAASTTEVLLTLLEEMETKYEKTFVTDDVATLLLAGLITDTGSFQHANTSPKAMETAAKLLDKGARQQEIIKNIYKTKKLSTLKLWGSVLSKVQSDPIYRLVWSTISKQDLEESGASSDESETIIDDLLSNAPGTEVVMLFKYNDEGYVSVSMRSTTNSVDVGKICQEMGGGGHVRAAGFKRRDSRDLEGLVNDTLRKVRDYQNRRLNLYPEEYVHEVTLSQPVIKTEKPDSSMIFDSPYPLKKEEKKKEVMIEENQKQKAGESTQTTVQYLEFKDERKRDNQAKKNAEKNEPSDDQKKKEEQEKVRVQEKSEQWAQKKTQTPEKQEGRKGENRQENKRQEPISKNQENQSSINNNSSPKSEKQASESEKDIAVSSGEKITDAGAKEDIKEEKTPEVTENTGTEPVQAS